MRHLYTLLFHLMLPAILFRLLLKSRRLPAYRARIGERLGRYEGFPPATGVIWFHAVSVGEAEAAFPLVRAFLARYPHIPVLVTTTTPTGSERVQSTLDDAVLHVYLPYDLPVCVSRFLRRFRPVCAIILETEIWPNLFHACRARGIPLAVVNARLSERSARGYRRVAWLSAPTLAVVDRVLAQTEADAARFVDLGLPASRVGVTGNLKFDRAGAGAAEDQGCVLRSRLQAATRPVLIAGSTHAGEEALVLAAFTEVRRVHPNALLLLAPRRPERFGQVAAQCLEAGWRVAHRSRGVDAGGADVFLIDTLGELAGFYGAADVAFVGGSLIPHGGQNLLEPAAGGVPVVFGPHVENFQAIAAALQAEGGGVQVNNAEALAAVWGRLLADDGARLAMGRQARRFVEANRGAVGRTLEQLEPLLQRAGLGHSSA